MTLNRSIYTATVRLVFSLCGLVSASVWAAPPILVLNSLNADVSVIDPLTYTETKRIPVGKEPHHLYLTPDNKSVMVANAEGDSITFLDPKTAAVQRTMTGILDPYHLRFSPDMKWFVTAANRLNHIDIYRWERIGEEFKLHLVKRVPAGKTPSHIAIDSKSTVAYITLQDSNQLTAIELATQKRLWTISVGKIPADLYLTPDDKTLLIGLTGEDAVEAYDMSSGKAVLKTRIPTGKGAHAFRSQGDKRHVFVSNRSANTISRIDWTTLKVVDTYKTPAGPDCMEMMADGKTLLVTARWASRLAVIDIEKKAVVKQIPVGKSPHGVWTLNHASRD
ncbi:MAG: YncE family protein [Burkholderiales bacterium]|nr:YncE family protein [Burkholderiales bacterium]